MTEISLQYQHTETGIPAYLQALTDTFSQWRKRVRDRQILARMTQRQLTDIGIGTGERFQEVTKPFWRA